MEPGVALGLSPRQSERRALFSQLIDPQARPEEQTLSLSTPTWVMVAGLPVWPCPVEEGKGDNAILGCCLVRHGPVSELLTTEFTPQFFLSWERAGEAVERRAGPGRAEFPSSACILPTLTAYCMQLHNSSPYT